MEKFQVVIQFPDCFFESLDEVHQFEDRLIQALPSTHVVDGHDIGTGKVNFFVFTNAHQAVLRNFRKYLGTNKVEKNVRIAYRELATDDDYINLWPKREARPFEL